MKGLKALNNNLDGLLTGLDNMFQYVPYPRIDLRNKRRRNRRFEPHYDGVNRGNFGRMNHRISNQMFHKLITTLITPHLFLMNKKMKMNSIIHSLMKHIQNFQIFMNKMKISMKFLRIK
jgi:hypothetical protein